MAMAPPLLSFFFFFLLTCFFFNVYSSSASPVSYKDNCAAIVPAANLHDDRPRFIFVGQLQTAYFTGADRILGDNPYSQQNSIFLRLGRSRETDVAGVFQVPGSISITSTSPYYYVGNFSYSHSSYYRPHRSSVTIMLDGFWSATTGKLCMVGSGSDHSGRGKSLDLDVVLKLNNEFNSSNISSVVSGSLDRLKKEEGFDSDTFPVLMIPRFNYQFTLDSKESKNEFSHVGNDSDTEKSLPENKKLVCSSRVRAAIKKLNLEYSGDCNTPKNCTSFSGIPGFFPPAISLTLIECTFTEKKQLRVLINFGHHSHEDFGANVFNPNTTLVGEGWWDERKNHLNVVACHFLGLASSSFSGVHVGDCSVRLKLRFPSIWSIKDTSTVVGKMWSNKTVKDPDFFKAITFRNEEYGQNNVDVQGLKYEYTQQDTVKSLCPRSNVNNNKGRKYPSPYSYDMKFDMSVRDSFRQVAQGHSDPLSVADQFYDLVLPTKSATDNFITSGLFNVSYKIRMSLSDNPTLRDKKSLFSMYNETVKISAEGVYDAGTGSLCMVGCRILPPSNNVIPMSHSLDCEILVKFHFPPLYLRSTGYIVGTIESTRNESDPLYFNSLGLSSSAIYKEAARETVERMDMEIIMALISTTLYCVLVGFQLYHVKKNPQVLPFISLTMLSMLTLYRMVPLVLNFEALFSLNQNAKNFFLSNVAWLESNEITVRLITMVAFLLQFRLLQLAWSARNSTDGTHDSLWVAEKEAVYVTLPLYAAGFLIAMMKGKNNNSNNNHYLVTVSSSYQQASSWEVLKSYGGLINDGFLLPQIMMNMVSNIKKDALCGPFYLGTSFLRLLPHVYDLYRTSQYDRQYRGSYLYADPSADFYSTAWDLAIIVGCLLFALIIYLQQHFGGYFVVPCRFRGSGTYEMVPIVTQEAEEVEEEEEEWTTNF